MKNHSLPLKKGKNNAWWGNPSKWTQKKTTKKKVELVIFGDSTPKKIDPSFQARCAKSLALNYSVEGTKGWWLYEQTRIFGDNTWKAAVTKI